MFIRAVVASGLAVGVILLTSPAGAQTGFSGSIRNVDDLGSGSSPPRHLSDSAATLEQTQDAIRRGLLPPRGSATIELGDLERSVVADGIGRKLRDPTSAQFEFPKYNGSAHYCVLMNAKNGHGGYVGVRPVHVDVVGGPNGKIRAVSRVYFEDAGARFAEVVYDVCKAWGYPFPH